MPPFVVHKSSATMPKTRKSPSNRSQATANLTGSGSPASSAGPSHMSANNLTISYTAMPTETLRFMLSQRHLNQTGPRRVLITRLQESELQVPEQLSATIASIVEGKLKIHKWTGRPACNCKDSRGCFLLKS